MKYLVKGGIYQREYATFKEQINEPTNSAQQYAFNCLHEILVDKYVYMCDSLRDTDSFGFVSFRPSVKNKLKYLQAYGIPKMGKIYEGIREAQPNDIGALEIIEGFDYLLSIRDNREVEFHNHYEYGFKIK